MRTLLIIYPHWPPSNLAGVHRPRLIANYLSEFGWHPLVLTVHEKYYEEKPDWDLVNTVSQEIEVIKTKAFPVIRPRIIGDIGLRSFYHIYKKACQIIKSRKIDFIWIPIPSFYMALMGRILNNKFGIPYGIDYIDPWVRDISTRRDLRHRLSNLVANILEPIAVKKASLISGVAYEYFKPVLQRNFPDQLTSRWLSGSPTSRLPNSPPDGYRDHQLTTLSFPYGFDPHDHEIVLKNLDLPWKDIPNCKPIVYAGAFLPKSRMFVEALFQSIDQLRQENKLDPDFRFYFLGTGTYQGESMLEIARRYNLGDIVIEIRDRFPFLHILNYLSAAFAVLIVGSTEKHYTASKTFQSLLSKKPVIALIHEESDAVNVMKQCKADQLLASFKEGDTVEIMKDKIGIALKKLFSKELVWNPDLTALEPYSAKRNAELFANNLNEIVDPQPSSEMPVTRVQINK